MRKDVFIDEHERSDLVKDQNHFLTKIEDFKQYMVRFEENSAMKPGIYLSDCVLRDDDCLPIIVITYNECNFSANDGIWRA